MIRMLAVNCTAIRVCSNDDGKTAVETASDEMVMGGLRPLSEFSQLGSQHNHTDLSLKALDDVLRPLYQKKSIFQE
jgi:hypothetical protein